MILIQSARQVTNLFHSVVYTPSKFSVYPISLEPNLNLLENSDERYLLSILKSHLDHAIGRMFFTYHRHDHSTAQSDEEPWNLTITLQRQSLGHSTRVSDNTITPNHVSPDDRAPWKRSDDRFFWNKHIQSKLIDLACQPGNQEAGRFILPVIFGFLEFKSAKIEGKPFTFGIISRRSRYRAGTRYFSRGINSDGDVSNFNETEMILTTSPPNHLQTSSNPKFIKASFVQTRGSVPLFWTEINNLRYRPDLKIIDIPESLEAMKAHFDQQIEIYGDQYLVNLVNSSGYERAVKDAYEKGVKNLNNPRVHYTYFDFHRECKGLRFDKVQILIDQLEDKLIKQGYFLQESSNSSTLGATSSPLSTQTSVVRTNCMDCLDRTNVLQSALAKWVLTRQLKQAGILNEQESLDLYPDFMFLFRNLWADNADAVSRAYSGTPALKTDFTRLGIRTKKGALLDGANSAMRYIKNNFLDGPRQDSFDLFTGAWVSPSSSSLDPEANHKSSYHLQPLCGAYDNPILQAIVLFFVIFLLISVSSTFTKKRSWSLTIFSLIVLALITRYMLTHGMEFVNQPRLKTSSSYQTRDRIINYSGPTSRCFESSRHGRAKIDFGLIEQVLARVLDSKHLSYPRQIAINSGFHPGGSSTANSNMISGSLQSTSNLGDDDKKRKD